ncbi:MAG: hypothetical protein M3512_03155 [Bacteroidota bacterium]|nr:hypothetical protein [Bacteroidota bacterium]
MKKSLLILIGAICFSFTAKAQISQGTKSLGGTVNFTSSSTMSHYGSAPVQTQNSNSLTFGPRIGYFISDGLAVGVALQYWGNTQNGNPDIYKENMIALSPFARVYKSLGEQFYIFGEGMISVGAGGSKKIEPTRTLQGNNTSLVGLYISPGFIFFPTEKIGLELSFVGIQFESRSSKNPENRSLKTVNSNFKFGPDSFSPNIGIQYYF